MASIIAAVAQVKDELTKFLNPDFIQRCMDEHGYTWRDRQLDPVTTIQLFAQQVLHGNVSCREVRQLAEGDKRFSGSAYCQARSRLPLEALQTLVRRIGDAALRATDEDDPRWHGHRVRTTDGSGISMPDTPELQAHFGQHGMQKPGCGFPIAHTLAQFHAGTGLLVDIVASPLRTHDMAKVPDLIGHVEANDVILGDCAFCTYAHFALLLRRGAHGVFPNHQKRIIDFTPGRKHVHPSSGKSQNKKGRPRSRWVRELGREDQIVEWFKPAERPSWMTREDYDALPPSIHVRELRRKVLRADGRTVIVTLVTTLLDAERYPADELVKLGESRWAVEVNLRHLKTTMGMDVLRCKSVEGVMKELTIYALVYNLVRVVMLEAARRQQMPVDRVSFIDAYTWLRHAPVGEHLPRLVMHRRRPGRLEPRVLKRRKDTYSYMTRPREELRNALKYQGVPP